MIASWHRKTFRFIDILCGETIDEQRIPSQKAGDVGLFFFLWCQYAQTVEEKVELPVI